ncbi:MAG: GHKL domain-containing protein [Clostridium luticellarii]|uniref:sensor histidine kinase n=2 Tax=Clostridium luticellarii TaxID=1691940 RepID=UPI00235723B2|nr:GHKL domain-containing protein [Clostridium luticellarii]MCI2039640.1 GHKL domain-containing protein [Clostridium luticellarii]
MIIFYNVSGSKINKKAVVVFILINTLADLITIQSKSEYLLLLVSSVVLICFSLLNFTKVYYSIFVIIFTDVVFAASDAIVVFLGTIFFHINFNTISKYSLKYFFMAIIITFISFIISKLVRKTLNKIDVYDYETVKNSKNNLYLIFYIGIILGTIYLSVIEYKYSIINSGIFLVLLNVFNILSVFVIAIMLVYLNNKNIKNKLEKGYKEKELKQLTEYTNVIENMSDDLRRFKHDYANIMQVLSSYIKANDIEGLKTFYKDELEPENEKIMNKNKSLYLIRNIKIHSLKGLLFSKIRTAALNNIDVRIEITDTVYKLSVNELDLCRIIGILFDNAIEAAALCNKKIIHLAIIKNNIYTYIIIDNTCLESTPPIYKIYEDDFSTKGKGRGLGLKTVRKIINEKYANVVLHTKIEKCIFTQKLIIKDLN